MRVSETTMTFFHPTTRVIPVRRAVAHVSKSHDGSWRAFVAIELAPEYAGLDGSPYYREERNGLESRSDAIRVCRAWLLDHLGGTELPDGIELRIERSAPLAFNSILNPARPFDRLAFSKESAA